MKTTTLPQKIEWVNSFKAFVILMIVLGHIETPFGNVLYFFHLPVFFFVAGFFLKTDISVKKHLKKEFPRLMLPFFIFGALGATLEFLKLFLVSKYFPNLSQEFGLNLNSFNLKETFLGLTYWMDFAHLKHYGFVLWFLPALFVGKTLVFLLLKFVKNNWSTGLIITGLLLIVIKFKPDLPYAIDQGVLAGFYIYLGFLYFNFLKPKLAKNEFVILPFLLIPIVILYKYIPSMNIAVSQFGILSIFYSLLIVFLLALIFSKFTKKYQLIHLIGLNTMLFFVFHPYTNNLAYFIGLKFFPNAWYLNFAISVALLLGMVRMKDLIVSKLGLSGLWNSVILAAKRRPGS